jgi:hypothetical protein
MRRYNLLQRDQILRQMRSVIKRLRSTANRGGVDSAANIHGTGRKVPADLSFDEAMHQLYGTNAYESLPDEPAGPCSKAAAEAEVVCIGGKQKQTVDDAGNYHYEHTDKHSPGCCPGYAYDEIPGSHGPYRYCYKA